MAFRFEKASCVVVGTFNMYILHPQWLADHGIIEVGADVGIETNLTQPGFRFRLPENTAAWKVTPERLVVESRKPEIDCGDTVARVLKALPETPLFALGSNVHYQADPSELENLSDAIRNFPRIPPPTPGQSVEQRTFHMGVKRDDRQSVNVQMSLKEDGIELVCNVHTELANREKANEAAIAAATQFLADRTESTALAQHFFGASTDHGPTDS